MVPCLWQKPPFLARIVFVVVVVVPLGIFSSCHSSEAERFNLSVLTNHAHSYIKWLTQGMKLFMTYKHCSLCVTSQKTAVKTGLLLVAPILEAREFGLNIQYSRLPKQMNLASLRTGSQVDKIKQLKQKNSGWDREFYLFRFWSLFTG